jgi:hypothetical protein
LPNVIDWMADRLVRDATPALAGDLWSMTLLILGLRYDEDAVQEVIRRMNWLREFVTYHIIREEGRDEGRDVGQLEGERRLLLRLGTVKLGAPPPHVVAATEGSDDLTLLERLGVTLLTASSWNGVLAGLATD